METKRLIYYQDEDWWIGWLEEYPDYRTQGQSFEELKENLKDIYEDVAGGKIPYVRKVGEITVP